MGTYTRTTSQASRRSATDGSLIQRFGSGELSGGGAIVVDAADDEVFVAEPGEGKIAVFSGEAAAAPTVNSVVAQSLTPASERLTALIDPHGLRSTYYVQYGTSSCVQAPSRCTDAPVGPPGEEFGEGFGDVQVNVTLEGLSPDTTYYYRVLAENADGLTEGAQSAQTFFTTLPSATGLLADDREWELVSPAEKHGVAVEPISREGALIQAATDGDSITWTASGPVTGEAEGDRRPEPVQVISKRTSREWVSQDVTSPHDRGEGINPGEATEYRYFSPDLSFALVQPQVPSDPVESPPLAPEAREKTIYRRENATGVYKPLVTAADDTAGSAFGGHLEFAGATPDLRQVVFSSEVPLLAGAGQAGLYEWEEGAPLRLVSVLPGAGQVPASEPFLGDQGRDARGAISADGSRVFWTQGLGDEGPLYMRDTLTDETVQVNAAQGVSEAGQAEVEAEMDEVHFQDASSNGSRVFFTDTWPLTSESALEAGEEEAVVEGESARAGGRPADLYEYNVETGILSDLTPDHRVGETADVLGTIPGASEDGSYVYFVANGVLAPGAQPGDCPRTKPLLSHPEAACNLYLSEPAPEHPGQRQTVLVARLSYEDAGDWGGANSPLPGDLGGVTSQVSANGQYLAFMSDQALTGYDNVNADPEAHGARDEEVYLYDAAGGRLVCASCNPDGEPPVGVFDTENADEGLGLVVNRPETWSGRWLAGSLPGWTLFELINPIAEHQSRYLSNNGRLFFDSADALLPGVQERTREETVNGQTLNVGVENVYEYEPAGEGSCTSEAGCVSLISSGTSQHESAFLDASENGDDAFFVTAAKLVAQDTDSSLDVYDARVCGTGQTEPCLPAVEPPPPSCTTGEGCRPAQTAQPSLQVPASSTFSGSGNEPKQQVSSSKTTTVKSKPLTRAQKLASALKVCHKRKDKRKRQACERRARKAYGAKAKPNQAKKRGKKAATRGRGH